MMKNLGIFAALLMTATALTGVGAAQAADGKLKIGLMFTLSGPAEFVFEGAIEI